MKTLKAILITGMWGVWLFLSSSPANALPSFARQTGMSCAACHTVFPELTTYGRTFKLNGYTSTNSDELKDGADDTGYRLEVNNTPPLAAMMQITDTWVKTPTSTTVDLGSDKNGNVEFPNQLSLFYAGRISTNMGAFAQITYNASTGSLGMDNTDIRLANRYQIAGTDLIWGFSANNNPTVQDVFNSVPAWNFPYANNHTGFGAPALTQIESSGQKVAGLGTYAFWNQLVYLEFSGYRTAPQGFGGTPTPNYNAIQGVAPYWRLALTKDFDKNSIEIGAFGLDQHNVANTDALPVGPQDHFTDVALDGQYQYVDKDNAFTLKGDCIWENQVEDYSSTAPVTSVSGGVTTIGAPAVANPSNTLRSLRLDGTYYFQRTIGATVGYFSTTGSADATLYAANASTTPDTEDMVYELNYVPWLNTKFGLQYTYFFKYNGSTDNYDGSGRHATDNNTLMASAWLMY